MADDERVAQIEARLQAATPGPWWPDTDVYRQDIAFLLTKVKAANTTTEVAVSVLDHLRAELAAAVRRAETAEAEVERLKSRLWQHGDSCSQECTAACSEMHTYGPGCWFAS